MAIIIKGDNNGLAVDGTLNIRELCFEFGKGVTSVKVERSEIQDAEIVEENCSFSNNCNEKAKPGARRIPLEDCIDYNQDKTRVIDEIKTFIAKNQEVSIPDIVKYFYELLKNGVLARFPSFNVLVEEAGMKNSHSTAWKSAKKKYEPISYKPQKL